MWSFKLTMNPLNELEAVNSFVTVKIISLIAGSNRPCLSTHYLQVGRQVGRQVGKQVGTYYMPMAQFNVIVRAKTVGSRLDHCIKTYFMIYLFNSIGRKFQCSRNFTEPKSQVVVKPESSITTKGSFTLAFLLDKNVDVFVWQTKVT